MIYIDLKGNLGNQLFEYACARAIQEITNEKICINTYFLNKYRPEYKCNLQNYILNDNVCFVDNKPLPWFVNTYAGPMRYIKKLFPKLTFSIGSRFNLFIWLNVLYKSIKINKRKKDIYMVGYWQSSRYFNHIKQIIYDEFIPKYDLISENKELYEIINKNESICVTIRRGDYISNPKFKKEYFMCDSDYFVRGINKIRELYPNAVVICFSDDIEWVKNNVRISGEVYYESGKDPVWEKLRMMSMCKHFVISNSSFSWWAQYLSRNDKKVVIAPNKWYPDGRKCDIFEPNWTLVEME